MNDSMNKLKSEVKARIQFWNNIKSRRVKAFLIILFVALIFLKIFTTVLTFDWLAGLFN